MRTVTPGGCVDGLFVDGDRIRTTRLLLRPFAGVPRWPAPAVEPVESCQGRWAIELRATGRVVGGVTLLPLPPYGIDLRVGWQIAPDARGRGFAAEAGHAVAHHAFAAGLDEIFAVVRPWNAAGAATARRVGMDWVGRTRKYYDLELDVYRFRRGDLDVPTFDVAPPGADHVSHTRTTHDDHSFAVLR